MVVVCFAGAFFSGRKVLNSNFGKIGHLEDGRKFRMEEVDRRGSKGGIVSDQRSNLTGKIRSIQEGKIVIDKFAMSVNGQGRQWDIG